MSLPITAGQRRALQALQITHPELGNLVTAVGLAFDASKTDNPELARLILEKTCRRILVGQSGSYEALSQHLQHFGSLGCLSLHQVAEFSARIKRLAE